MPGRPSIHAVSILAALVSVEHADADDAPLAPREAAVAAARWIDSTRVETADGVVWPTAPGVDDPVADDTIAYDLYAGTPGVILFYLELARVTGDAYWRDEARRGADALIAWRADTTEDDPGLWTGMAGEAFMLHRVHVATGERVYLDATRALVDRLRAAARPTADGGVTWNDTTDVIAGAAGIGLFLLYAADAMDDPEALKLAERAGIGLVASGRRVEADDAPPALEWAMTPDFPRLMPNFSHGTAGNAYFLATLHERLLAETRPVDGRFLDAARAGARHVTAIADRTGDGCRVHHHTPDGEDLYYLGWCHGPIGTAALFERLARVDPDGEWRPWVDRCVRSVLASGIPERRTPGFWENVGQCCGSAGVAAFFMRLHETRPDDEHLTFAARLNDDVMTRATRVELADGGVGLRWVQVEHRVRPELRVAQTGYMQGAAGIGLWLLQLDAARAGDAFPVVRPDSPWGRAPSRPPG